jgi:hypothetical protein
MPLDTKQSLRDMTNAFLCKPIGRAMTNPLTLAFILTVIIMIIVVCSYDRDHRFRTMFRIFSISTLFMFINNHILMDDMNCKLLNNDQRKLFNIMDQGASGGGSTIVPDPSVETPKEEDEEESMVVEKKAE